MKIFDWKDKYTRNDGADVTADAKYYSLLGTKIGKGTRDNPIYSNYLRYTSNADTYVFGSGVFDSLSITATYGGTGLFAVGQGFDTYFKDFIYSGSSSILVLYNMRVKPKTIEQMRYYNCYIEDHPNTTPRTIFGNSILKNCSKFQISEQNQCTFIDSHIPSILPNTSLFSNCSVLINQSSINSYRNNYLAFNNCKFQIGNETSATVLVGSNTNELRQNFVNRCTAQNITVPLFTEYGEINISMGRWIFSDSSIAGEYNTIENSEIDQFSKKRGFYLGHTDKTVKVIPIVSANNVPQSFAPANPISKTLVSDNSITLDKTTSIVDRHLGYADSKIIWLGGKYELTALNVINSLPADVGVSVDSLFNFGDPVTSGAIENEINYIVRSSDKQPASIKYNGVEYSTSLVERNNVFRGINNMKTCEVVSGKPQILPVLDFANHNSVQMRIVSELPTTKITNGNLQAGYWYFVAPNNLSDTSGSVTYKGVERPCFDSFLADANTTFTVSGSCHLRRCWKNDYSPSSETIDGAFWSGKQKPKWFDVLPSDLRCFHKNNSPSELEMQNEDLQDEDSKYIVSGHIDFYNGLNGSAGFKTPAFPITGSFMQIRIPISTLNPM